VVLGWAAAASAETTFGDVGVSLVSSPSGNSWHGYVEYVFRVQNHSPDQPHQVEIVLPADGYGSRGSLQAVSRTVVVAPNTTVSVSLMQCALDLSGTNAAVFVDGRPQEQSLEMSVVSHGERPYYGRSRDLRMVLMTRGLFVRPDFGSAEKSVTLALAENGVTAWSADWLAYTPYDGIIVSADDMARMPAHVRLALTRYVEAGGTLLVVGAWTPPDDWHVVGSENAAFTCYPMVFGQCLVTESLPVPLAPSPFWDALAASAAPWEETRDVDEANREFPVIDSLQAPIRAMLLLVLGFVVLAGPVNLLILARKNRRIWMLVTVPALSLVTCGLVFAYSVMHEGFRGWNRVHTLTVLDENTGRATTLGWAAYYSPIASSSGLHFSYQTELSPQMGNDYSRYSTNSGNRRVDWTSDQHLASGWLQARVPVHFLLRKSENRRERLAVHTRSDGGLTVVNGLGAAIERLVLADDAGRLYVAEHVSAGAEVALSPLPAAGLPKGAGLGDLYVLSWLGQSEELSMRSETFLRPGVYVATLADKPFVETAQAGAETRDSCTVVYGILKRPAHGS